MKIKKMKIKPIAGAILGLVVTTAVVLPVKADESRNCRIDRNTGVLICENRNNRNQRYDTVEQRIDQLYREVLGRRADRDSLRAYSDRILRAGWDYSQVRSELARSAEARENIRNSYRQIIGRNPDSDTIRRYQVNLERGWSIDRVRQELTRSRDGNRNRRDDRSFRVEQRIDQLYREVLGRRADQDSLRAYSDRILRAGWDYSQVRSELARSAEARENIRNSYRQIIGRNPDSDTIRRYQVNLERGWSIDRVRQELTRSRDGNRNRRDDRSFRVEQRIDQLYREVLGRRADRDGLRTYSDRMLRAGWDENRVRQDLARSGEARDRINQLYREILGRNADPGGLRNYQRHLEQGWSLDQVRRELQNSPEARNRRNNYRFY